MLKISELFDELNEENCNEMITEFMRYKGALKLEEANNEQLHFININTKHRTMAQTATIQDRIQSHIEHYQEIIDENTKFSKSLSLDFEEEFKLKMKCQGEIYEAEIAIKVLTKLQNNEIQH